MSNPGGRGRILISRDIEILYFIWRWKIVSTASISLRLFPSATGPHAAYQRLEKLRRQGYVKIQFIDPNKHCWTLRRKGFNLIRERLPANLKDHFRSETPEHDYFVSSVHLGPGCSEAKNEQCFSEQELRSFPLDCYPAGVPQSEIHRPDGYWIVPTNGRFDILALEVELNQKANKDYALLGQFYSDNENIFRVVWVVPTIPVASLIQEKIHKQVPSDYLIHDFILCKDIERRGWNAPIRIGFEQGEPLSFLLESGVLRSSEELKTLWNFDGRKCPYPLNSYPAKADGSTSNRSPIQTVSSSSQLPPNSDCLQIPNLSLVTSDYTNSTNDEG